MGSLPGWGAINQGVHSMGQHLVPSPAPRPQLTEEMLCVLVRGAALGRQSTPGPESGMPGPALAFTDSSRGAFNKLHAPDLCSPTQWVQHFLPLKGCLIKYEYACIIPALLQLHPKLLAEMASSEGHFSRPHH